jgi:hypothetical protein
LHFIFVLLFYPKLPHQHHHYRASSLILLIFWLLIMTCWNVRLRFLQRRVVKIKGKSKGNQKRILFYTLVHPLIEPSRPLINIRWSLCHITSHTQQLIQLNR